MTDGRNKENGVEIIAEKSRAAAYAFLALAVVGVIVAAAGVYLLAFVKNATVPALCLMVGGLIILIIFTVLFARQLFRPYALITLKDGLLNFFDGTVCKPHEITALEKGKDSGSRSKITVVLPDRKITVKGVANGERAIKKLSLLADLPEEQFKEEKNG